MLLEAKNAVIYGGGGNIGASVARGFAREGATVHLAGRTPATLERVAEDIHAAGGTAMTAQVDALDGAAVDAFADAVAADAGSLDISINLISVGDVQGTPLAEMTLDDFEQPIRNALRSTFLTSRAAARHMIQQRSGVILMFGGEGDPVRNYSIGGFQIALTAVEALRRQLASELGRHGVGNQHQLRRDRHVKSPAPRGRSRPGTSMFRRVELRVGTDVGSLHEQPRA